MSALLTLNAIWVYHRIFDFFGVCIPFSSFLLSLIKYYKVHFSQLGHLGLNKVVTIEVLYRSLQIEPTVTLFRVLYEGLEELLLFYRQEGYSRLYALEASRFSYYDPKPPLVLTIKRMSGRVGLEIRLSRVLMEMLWVFMIFFVSLSGAELRFRRSFIMISDLSYRGFLSIVPLAAAYVAILDPTLEDLVAGTSNAKVMAKFESSKKRKALLSGAAPSHVAKRTRSAMAQSSGSTTRPNLFVADSDDESDDDEDAWNPGGGSAAPVAEGSSTRDSQGKGIMTDVAEASSEAVGHPRPSFVSDPSFRGLSVDAIHRDFFPFSPGPYYVAYPADGVAGNYEFSREEWDAPHQPTLKVLTKEVFKDPVVCKIVVDQFPTPGEMVRIEALCFSFEGLESQVSGFQKQVTGLNDKLSSSDAAFVKAKAKGKEQKKKIKSLTKNLDQLNAEVACLSIALNQAAILEAEKDDEILRLKASPPEVQGELLSLAASARFECGLSMHRTHEEFAAVLKKISHFVPGAQERLVEASPLVAKTGYSFQNKIFDHAADPLSVILHLEPEKLASSANVPVPKGTRVPPPVVKESTVTPVSSSLELLSKTVPSSFAAASRQNKEWINAMVDVPDNGESRDVFLQGISHTVDGDARLALYRSERVSSDPIDVVVALSLLEGEMMVPSLLQVLVKRLVLPPGV
ncbi:hypothetical protein Tco_0599179 [Tanacetum coccineum]